MKNGIYIEDYGASWKNTEVFYKNGIKVYEKFSDGLIRWFNEKGKLHKLDGPAIYAPDYAQDADFNFIEYKKWYIDGKCIDVKTQEEFIRYLNTLAFR